MGQNLWGRCCALVVAASLSFAAVCRTTVSSEPSAPEEKAKPYSSADMERRIERTLSQPLERPFDFTETPLNQIMETVADEYDLPIQFDVQALDLVSISPEMAATISVADVSLRSALNLTLRNAGEDLAYVIENDVLLITTQEAADSQYETRVYQVGDLDSPPPHPNGATAWSDHSPLFGILTSCVEPETWKESGAGKGDLRRLRPGVLVVYQTERVHRRIERLVADLRHAIGAIEERRAIEHAEAVRRNPFGED